MFSSRLRWFSFASQVVLQQIYRIQSTLKVRSGYHMDVRALPGAGGPKGLAARRLGKIAASVFLVAKSFGLARSDRDRRK